MHSDVRDQKLKIIRQIDRRLLYINVTLTKSQNSIIDTHT